MTKGKKEQNRKRKYNKQVCLLIYALGYSYEDIADIYAKATNTPSNKSGVYKVLQDANIRKSPERINPTKIEQKYIDFLQREGVYFHFLELYNLKYTKPVRDRRFGYF